MKHATLTTARALTDEQLRAITARFTKVLGDTPEFTVVVDAALIGGICVQSDGVLYDGSIKGRLAGYRKAMLSED